VVLIDIDGTLLSTSRTQESEKRRYVEAIRDVVGVEPHVVPSRFAGMVDPQICKILLAELGLNNDMVTESLPNVLTRMAEVYCKMQKEVVLNLGVRGLLAVLATSPRHVVGVLTGNLKAIAEEKLTRADIRIYFSELFCADNYFDRKSLVEDAVRTCITKYGLSSNRDVVIVGDTPLDIEAANMSHSTSVGVASGVYSTVQLSKAGAAQVYASMKPTRQLLTGLGVI